MQWVILIGNEDLDINSVRKIKHFGENKITDLSPNRFVVDYGDEHVFYEYVEDLIKDYKIEELKKIPFQNPHFIMMTYTSEKLMKKILGQDNFLKGIYVDDDYGGIVPIEQFSMLCESGNSH
ncbi:hypothetical protein [Acetonema longum]|uniref:Uncharacterized protein n=1 Tax=Acetonema longum DSM 6540 TaxID=1009370 RepID=F7NLG4_9FIRM|nr:hypothetical protein [Acetonema longum]EGO63119.1 hypothetical protein ALO_14682 [Acetonema longum DSM 6540]